MSSGTPHEYCINTLKTIRDITRNRLEPQLTAREYQVLITLLTYRNSVTFKCNPSMKRLSIDIHCAKSTIQKAIGGLKEKGYVRVTVRYNFDKQEYYSTQYWIMHDSETVDSAFNTEESHDYLICYHDEMIELYEQYCLDYKIPYTGF